MTPAFQKKLARILDLIKAMDAEPGSVYRCAICGDSNVNIYRSRNVTSIEDIKLIAKDEQGSYIGLCGNGDGPEGFSLGFGSDISTEAGVGIPGMYFDGEDSDYVEAAAMIIGWLRDQKVPELATH